MRGRASCCRVVESGAFDDLVKSDLPPTPCWIGPPSVVPKGGLILLGGEPKIGKTWIALEVTRALSSGGELFERSDFKAEEPCRVLYIDQELGPEALKERVQLCYADDVAAMEQVHYITQRETVVDLSDRGSRDEVYGVLDQLKPNVVVFDPMEKMHAVNENDAMFTGMADGSLDAVLEIWPSGITDAESAYFDDGTVIDIGELGAVGRSGWHRSWAAHGRRNGGRVGRPAPDARCR